MKQFLYVLTVMTAVGLNRGRSQPIDPGANVSIRNMQFSPATVELKAGQSVVWKNDDLVPHTATSSSFDSKSIAPGASWTNVFKEAGNFSYICTFHPAMKGTVVVK